MLFNTPVNITDRFSPISHNSLVVMLGSCFAQEIGNYFTNCKFNALVNPFGVLYNPLSIAVGINRVIDGNPYTLNDIFCKDGVYHSFDHHSSFSSTTAELAIEKINTSLAKVATHITNASHLFITFGTAWVYELGESGRVVSNCHKLPAATFNRRRVSHSEMFKVWCSVIDKLIAINKGLKIITTVSPVRHLKDGAHQNALSKSELLLLCEELKGAYPNCVEYFPAYEIVLDELRDYRFFANDMVHPANITVKYIWERVCEVMFSKDTIKLIASCDKVKRGLEHRVLTDDVDKYRAFLLSLKLKIEKIIALQPAINFEKEICEIDSRIDKLSI